MSCNFSITYKSVDARDGQLYWITNEAVTVTILDNGFVEVKGKDGNEFILPQHMVGKIDRLPIPI